MSTLFVAWQSPAPTRAWFPIGRLDAENNDTFLFRYTRGALDAHKQSGFEPLLSFPKFENRYESNELFPIFKNRVLDPSRKDFAEYLGWLDLDPAHADPIEILGLTGGERQTAWKFSRKSSNVPTDLFRADFFCMVYAMFLSLRERRQMT